MLGALLIASCFAVVFWMFMRDPNVVRPFWMFSLLGAAVRLEETPRISRRLGLNCAELDIFRVAVVSSLLALSRFPCW